MYPMIQCHSARQWQVPYDESKMSLNHSINARIGVIQYQWYKLQDLTTCYFFPSFPNYHQRSWKVVEDKNVIWIFYCFDFVLLKQGLHAITQELYVPHLVIWLHALFSFFWNKGFKPTSSLYMAYVQLNRYMIVLSCSSEI